jgi:tRNA threonylcarbamoyladenosine biosynthesis protein TsaB
MLILTLRTDKHVAEIGLYDNDNKIAYYEWQAYKELSETIHRKIKDILSSNNYDFNDIQGVIVFQGPGSFTGLRIGISVANALAYSLNVPIVAAGKEDWIISGVKRLSLGGNDELVTPEYGALPHITTPKK